MANRDIGEAGNGREAVRLARKLNPDVILMDIAMPEMDGIEATTKIKETHPHISIIGLTMLDDPATQTRMMNSGATSYLYKASPAEEIIKAIRSSLS